ncbi:MAG: hypothetical protein OEW15_14515 [Nitrospirota bacterium]|nr:hypothetical protein [Nitrospirota bacterium]
MTCTYRNRRSISQIIFLLLVLTSLFQASYAFAEIVKGPANLREKPEGKILLTLNDGAVIDLLPPYITERTWHPLGLVAYVEKTAFINIVKNPQVKADSILYDINGVVVGKTIDQFKVGWDIGEKNSRIGVVIEHVFINTGNIKPDSIPEYELIKFLDRDGPIQKSTLQGFLNKYKFEKNPRLKDGQIEEYFILESWIEDLSPMPRLLLIFYKNNLVKVIHRNLVTSKKYVSQELFRNMKVMDTAGIDADGANRIQKAIIEPLRTAD